MGPEGVPDTEKVGGDQCKKKPGTHGTKPSGCDCKQSQQERVDQQILEQQQARHSQGSQEPQGAQGTVLPLCAAYASNEMVTQYPDQAADRQGHEKLYRQTRKCWQHHHQHRRNKAVRNGKGQIQQPPVDETVCSHRIDADLHCPAYDGIHHHIPDQVQDGIMDWHKRLLS